MKRGSSSPTFHHHNSTSESNIDMFLISKNLENRLDQTLVNCTLNEPLNFSCHDLLLSTLSIPAGNHGQDQSSKFSKSYTLHDRVTVLWDSSDIAKYQDYAGSLLSMAESHFSEPECNLLKCELYSKLLVNAAISTCEVRQPSHTKSS